MKTLHTPVYKHPQIYADLLTLYRMYWNVHRHLPKSFRLTTSDDILREITFCVKCVIQANNVDKKQKEKCIQASLLLEQARTSLMTVRGLITLGWNMKFISHGAFANFAEALDGLEKQATRWQAWFDLMGHQN